MLIVWASVAVAGPSPGVWVSGPTEVSNVNAVAGGPSGWLLVGNDFGEKVAQRVDATGALVDATPLPAIPSCCANPLALWDGTDYVVIANVESTYSYPWGTVGAARILRRGVGARQPHRLVRRELRRATDRLRRRQG
jgi:hypothetical protein